MENEEIKFQLGVGVRNTKENLKHISLSELHQSISVAKIGGVSYMDSINSIRNSPYKSENAQKTKTRLPFVIPSVHLLDDKIGRDPMKHLGVVGLDLDFPELFNRDERMKSAYEAKKRIKDDPFVILAFFSPQYGVKIFVKVPPSIKEHERNHHAVALYFANKYGFEHDRGANGMKKYCFLSYDPEPVYNPNCLIYDAGDSNYESNQQDIESVTNTPSSERNERKEPSKEPNENSLKLSIELAVSSIVQNKKDITGKEPDWYRIGCAFSSLGEWGREYFHEVSQFHPTYSQKECDDKFNHCLNSNNGKINIGTFFHYCKLNNVSFQQFTPGHSKIQSADSKAQGVDTSILEELPSLNPLVFDQLPKPLEELCKLFPEGRRRDILFFAMLTVLAAAFHKIHGIFFGKKVKPILFTMVIAPPASGKSTAVWAKRLGELIDSYLQGLYQTEVETHVANEGKGPSPIPKMLFVPGNSSLSGILQVLSGLESAIIFETETDIVAAVFSTEFGNYSPILRALYEQEEASLYRKTNKEHIRITDSSVSLFLIGTPSQLPHLIKGGADGLYSRFCLYGFAERPQYLSPFKSVPTNLDDHFEQAGRYIFDIYNKMRTGQDYAFRFTDSQIEIFDKKLAIWQSQALNSHGSNAVSVVNRLGQMIFRIAMILTVLRTKFNGDQNCHDVDFDSAMMIGDTLRIPSLGILTSFPEPTTTPSSEGKTIERFFNSLGQSFSYAEAIALHKDFGISERSAKRYISTLEKSSRIVKDSRGIYSRR